MEALSADEPVRNKYRNQDHYRERAVTTPDDLHRSHLALAIDIAHLDKEVSVMSARVDGFSREFAQFALELRQLNASIAALKKTVEGIQNA